MSPDFMPAARMAVRSLRSSKIRDVANASMGREGVLPFWFGEPDEATPGFVCQAAIEALNRGETFYVQTLGMPELRATISAYLGRLHARPIAIDRVAVASSGTSALMLAFQALVEPGDRLVAVTPLWPNIEEMPKLLSATVDTVALEHDGQWRLDMQKLLDALTPGTKALLVNSPNNPTGWTLTAEEQQTILAHCRKHKIWIIADDVYERIYFDGPSAPSFLRISEADDLLISCNSFSKAWRMTGWRLGWIVFPASMQEDFSKLIEYNTTCSPPFLQRAGIAALESGEDEIQRSVQRFKTARDQLIDGLRRLPEIQIQEAPPGAMYLFFSVNGVEDSLDFCTRLVTEGGLGLAPGIAFGQSGEGYLRWCFASSPERLALGLEKLTSYLQQAC